MPEKMRLYHSPTTPFGRKVVVLLMETEQEADVEVVEVAGTPLAPGSLPLDRNPLGKIPALDRADGGALYDSRVICRYLDERAGTDLYPKGEALWPTLTLEATADGMMDAGVLMAYEMRIRPEDKRFADWTEAQWGKIARALDHLEANRLPQLAGPLTWDRSRWPARWATSISAMMRAAGATGARALRNGSRRSAAARASWPRFRRPERCTP